MAATGDDRSVTEDSSEDPAQVLLSWRSHPMQTQGQRRWIAVGVVIGIPLALGVFYGAFYAALAVAILAGSLASFFLPTQYVLYTGGLESRFLGMNRRFTWDQFRSYYPDRNGVLLSPFLQPSRLENFRGFYLRYNGHSQEVMRIVTERVTSRSDEGTSA